MNYLLSLHLIMMIELHDVTIGQRIKGLSAAVGDGQMVCFSGAHRSGKTTLLRALMGFIPIDGGYISIDGELLTPQSAPYFRRFTAYVPQLLSLPDGYDKVPTDYVLLVQQAVLSGKPIMVIDEPLYPLDDDSYQTVSRLLAEALQRGATVVAIGDYNTPNQIQLCQPSM